MENVTSFLQWEDKISIELQHLYELYGYDRYRMEKFEPYDMYMENKRFINASSVITFYDADGRLMALKPEHWILTCCLLNSWRLWSWCGGLKLYFKCLF